MKRIQHPVRRETDEQEEKRKEGIKLRNEEQGCNSEGRPVDKRGEPLKNLNKKERDIFISTGR